MQLVRDWHKKRAIKHNSYAHWALYKKLRNKVNTELLKNLITLLERLKNVPSLMM